MLFTRSGALFADMGKLFAHPGTLFARVGALKCFTGTLFVNIRALFIFTGALFDEHLGIFPQFNTISLKKLVFSPLFDFCHSRPRGIT